MTDNMDVKNVFYSIVIPFLAFFLSFAWFMYPHRDLIHPHALVDVLASHLPTNFAAPLSILRNWSFAVFYVMAEMWGSVVASLLFWSLANQITTVDEAKKYCKYSLLEKLTNPISNKCVKSKDPLFGLGANVALIFSGQYVKFVSNMRANLAPGVDAWAVSLKYLMGAVGVCGGVLLLAYKYIQEKIVAKHSEMQDVKVSKKKKSNMSLKESAKFLFSSPYIRDLATLVISYGKCFKSKDNDRSRIAHF